MDSLYGQLAQTEPTDTQNILILSDLGIALYAIDPQKTDSLGRLALERSEKIDFERGRAVSFMTLGIGEMMLGELDSSVLHLETALDLHSRLKDSAGIAVDYSGLGHVYRTQGKMDLALENYLASLQISQRMPGKPNIGKAYTNVGVVYFFQKNFPEAKRYFEMAIPEAKAENNISSLASLYSNLGACAMEMDSVDEGIEYFQKSLKLSEQQGNLITTVTINRNLGNIHMELGDPEESFPYLRKAMSLVGQLKSPYESSGCAKDLGEAFTQTGQYDSAKFYLDSAFSSAQSVEAKELEMQILNKYVNLYEAQGYYKKANQYLRSHYEIRDSLYSEERLGQLNELQLKFNVEKQEKENALLRAGEAESQAALDRNRNFFITLGAGIAVLVVVLVMLVLLLLLARRNNSKLTAKNTEIERQNARLEELNREKDGLVGIMAHDLRSPLMRVEGLVQLVPMQGELNEGQKETLGRVKKVTQDGSNLINDLLQVIEAEYAGELKFSQFKVSSILEGLKLGHSDHAKGKGIGLEITSEVTTDVYSDPEALQRILDNLLSNALKFSPSGTTVKVNAWEVAGHLHVSITDQGPGISPADQKRMFEKFQKLSARPTGGESSTGLGLAIVKSLSERLGGQLMVQSKMGKGTTFEFVMPLS